MGVGTDYQEISVSAVLPIFAEADLPGGRGGTVPTSVDKTCADVGVVRLAFVFGKRSIPTGRYNFRVHPFILPRPVGSNA